VKALIVVSDSKLTEANAEALMDRVEAEAAAPDAGLPSVSDLDLALQTTRWWERGRLGANGLSSGQLAEEVLAALAAPPASAPDTGYRFTESTIDAYRKDHPALGAAPAGPAVDVPIDPLAIMVGEYARDFVHPKDRVAAIDRLYVLLREARAEATLPLSGGFQLKQAEWRAAHRFSDPHPAPAPLSPIGFPAATPSAPAPDPIDEPDGGWSAQVEEPYPELAKPWAEIDAVNRGEK
jgi:hypothetical protein